MALTGKFKFRKTLWGRIVLQVEEEVKPFWRRSKPGPLKRRWRDATLIDLTAPEMRPLIDLRFRPHFWPASIAVPHREAALDGVAQPPIGKANGDLCRLAH
jgi:hypothetical protein